MVLRCYLSPWRVGEKLILLEALRLLGHGNFSNFGTFQPSEETRRCPPWERTALLKAIPDEGGKRPVERIFSPSHLPLLARRGEGKKGLLHSAEVLPNFICRGQLTDLPS